MMRRLVLGDGALGRTLIDHAVGQPGELFVVTADSGWVTTLRDDSIAAVEGDPADATHYPSAVDIVVVVAEETARTEQIAETARQAFPESTLIATIGSDATVEQRTSIATLADELIDPRREVTDRILDATTHREGGGMGQLLSTIRSLAKPLAVLPHDNPDPDAIASAVGLVRIAESVGVPAEACYFGEISHQENRALVNLLDLSLSPFEPDVFDPADYGAIALVDHAQPGVNDSLPEDTPVQIVIDHHPPRMPIDKTDRYVDIRPEVGSTSTIITEYFRRLGLVPDEQLSTALLYGIQTDTKQFTREVSEADFEAAAELSETASESALERIESPSVTASVVEMLATAIRRRDVRGSALATCVGSITDRDALAQTADDLLDMEGISTVLVYGYTSDMIYVSGRTRGTTVDLGETLREALDQIGSAGGHANMAGAQLPLGILSDLCESDELTSVVHDMIAERFFAALNEQTGLNDFLTQPPVGGPTT